MRVVLIQARNLKKGYISSQIHCNYTRRVYDRCMNKISEFVKRERKKAGLTQEEFALRSGPGLRFVRELEQEKETVRLDKVNQALGMFGMETIPGKIDRGEM